MHHGTTGHQPYWALRSAGPLMGISGYAASNEQWSGSESSGTKPLGENPIAPLQAACPASERLQSRHGPLQPQKSDLAKRGFGVRSPCRRTVPRLSAIAATDTLGLDSVILLNDRTLAPFH